MTRHGFLLQVADNNMNDHIASPIVAFFRSIYRRCTPDRWMLPSSAHTHTSWSLLSHVLLMDTVVGRPTIIEHLNSHETRPDSLLWGWSVRERCEMKSCKHHYPSPNCKRISLVMYQQVRLFWMSHSTSPACREAQQSLLAWLPNHHLASHHIAIS